MTEQNTAWLLAQWALWQREGVGLRMSAKSPMATFSRTACGAKVVSEICDDDALRVDAVMAKLKQVNPTWYKVLVLAFVRNYGDRQVATRLGITRYAAGKLYEEAYGWVDGEVLSGERLKNSF
jgi:hypothetical protein